MAKKYTLHLDALIIICLLFLTSVFANIYLAKNSNKTGDLLLDMQSKLVISQLNLSSANEELAMCQSKLDTTQ